MFLRHVGHQGFGLGAENGPPLVIREFGKHEGVVFLDGCHFLVGGFFAQGEEGPETVRPVELALAFE